MACAIEELGILNCFDSVFASSVGALTAAYLCSQEARKNRNFFAAMAEREDFIDLSAKALLTGQALKLDLLTEQFAPQGRYPLNTQKLTEVPLHPLVTKAGWHRAGSAGHLRDLSQAEEWPKALADAMRLPVLCGWPRGELRRASWDAAPHEAVPYRTPLEAGATHLLILRSAGKQADPKLPPKLGNAFKAVAQANRLLMQGVGMQSYREQIAAIEQARPEKIQQIKSPDSCPALTATPSQVEQADRSGELAFHAWWESVVAAR